MYLWTNIQRHPRRYERTRNWYTTVNFLKNIPKWSVFSKRVRSCDKRSLGVRDESSDGMIAMIIATAATNVMIGALDGGAIKADNDATLNQPGHRGGPKANNLCAAALF